MEWYVFDTWIVVTGALCAVACALLGNFLLLRKMSMMGDAISHAVLPGLALAFLLTQSRSSGVMFAGAAVMGVLTTVFAQWVNRFGHVDRGASMGIVFTGLFALGLLLIVQAADRVDLDPGCVLYGALELTPLDVAFTLQVGGMVLEVPRAVVVLSVAFGINVLFVVAFFKELRLSAFDPTLSTTLGFPSGVMHYALMTLVAVTTVASFEAVGSILVIAMFIVPPATAYLLTDRLSVMIGLSGAFAILSALLGHVGALTVPGWFGYEDTNTSGMMAVAAGLIFLVVTVIGPRYGLVARLRRGTHASITDLSK